MSASKALEKDAQSSRMLKKTLLVGSSKTPRYKAPEIPRSEKYIAVRRNKPVPCLTREGVRATP
jgi:hypothetical protein